MILFGTAEVILVPISVILNVGKANQHAPTVVVIPNAIFKMLINMNNMFLNIFIFTLLIC
jgi:hypothetical protein